MLSSTFIQYLFKLIPSIKNVIVNNNNITLIVPLIKIYPIIFFFKNHTNTQFKLLSDLCVVDFPTRLNRFELIYNFLSIRFNTRIAIKIIINELQSVPSIISIYKSANWWEREAWDMFGVFFHNHPDLRRILSDYGFEGYPLRKDFPLSGFTEVRYSECKKRVLYEEVTIPQEYRSFKFKSPWN